MDLSTLWYITQIWIITDFIWTESVMINHRNWDVLYDPLLNDSEHTLEHAYHSIFGINGDNYVLIQKFTKNKTAT